MFDSDAVGAAGGAVVVGRTDVLIWENDPTSMGTLGPFICTDNVCKIVIATEAALPVMSLDTQGNKSKDTSRTHL